MFLLPTTTTYAVVDAGKVEIVDLRLFFHSLLPSRRLTQ